MALSAGRPSRLKEAKEQCVAILSETDMKKKRLNAQVEEDLYKRIKMKSAEDTEAFVTANDIAITGRREFRGTKTTFIREPDRNVLELSGPGPSVAELIHEHVNRSAN